MGKAQAIGDLEFKTKTSDAMIKRVSFFTLKLFCSLLLAWAILEGAALARAWFYSQARRAQVFVSALTQPVITKVLVSPETAPTSEIIKIVAAENRINPILLQSIIDVESGGKNDAIRFEPAVYGRINRRGSDEERMLASSHGLMQVMGYHAEKTCGLKSWAELYNPTINIRCGARILLSSLQSSARGESRASNLRTALVRYNGVGEQAEKYAGKVMERIAELIINQGGL